jgi:hypothetical protein
MFRRTPDVESSLFTKLNLRWPNKKRLNKTVKLFSFMYRKFKMYHISLKIKEKMSVLSIVTQAGGGGKAELTISIQGCGSSVFIHILIILILCNL